MKVLVLTQKYPKPGITYTRMFVHVRNKYYVKHGISVDVINFESDSNYSIDGVNVFTYKNYLTQKNNNQRYDVLISHASNLRSQYRFLKKHGDDFERIVMFYHGHEILKINESYPKPYFYKKDSFIKNVFRNIYDYLKLRLWHSYIKKNINKLSLVFVSNWIQNMFLKNVRLNKELVNNKSFIINNSVGLIFETESYDSKLKKEYDFITIRGDLDGSKYCIDLVRNLAISNPEKKFLVIGKGKFFDFYSKPNNIFLINSEVTHENMIQYLNASKYGLLLTREDTQGVMTCEFETFGIPTITSDIEVCKEFFSNNKNVVMINNSLETSLDEAIKKFGFNKQKDTTFFSDNTIKKEIELLNSLVKNGE